MRVVCRHGHFKFYPSSEVDVRTFIRLTKLELVPEFDYFTFEQLKDLPRHSLAAQTYGNLPAIQTYEGRDASEVMRENQFVFHLSTKLLIPVSAITSVAELRQSTDYYISQGLILQPGVYLKDGTQVTDYHGEVNLIFQKLLIYGLGE